MVSHMSFLSLSGKMAPNRWLHHGFSFSCDHKAKGFQMELKDMLHATHSLKIAISYRNKRHPPSESIVHIS
jgi:hypothetical protein